jgi:hypothetical protein
VCAAAGTQSGPEEDEEEEEEEEDEDDDGDDDDSDASPRPCCCAPPCGCPTCASRAELLAARAAPPPPARAAWRDWRHVSTLDVSDCGAWLDIPTLSALTAAMPALTSLSAARCARLAASANTGGPLALFHALRPVARTLRILDLSSCRVHPTALLALLSFLPALEEVALARCFRAAPPPRRARRAGSWGGSGGDDNDDGGGDGRGDDEDDMYDDDEEAGGEDDPDALNACAMGDLECVIGTILACRAPRALNLSGNACVGALLRALARSRCAHAPPFFAHDVARHGAGPSLARLDLRGCGLRAGGGGGGADRRPHP